MPNLVWGKSNKQFRHAMKTMLPLMLILAGCSTAQTPPPPPTGLGLNKAPSKSLACTDFAPMHFQNGEVGITWAQAKVLGDAHPEDPLGWVRGALGDTTPTRSAISDYAAARKKLGCE